MKRKIILCIVVAAFAGLAYAQKAGTKQSTHYEEMVEKFGEEDMPDSESIVMLGDSHTEFGGDWKLRLRTGRRVVNRGIIGDDAKGILGRLGQVCPGRPKAIFFECGANDLSHGLSTREVAEGVIKTIEAIRRQTPTSILVVQSMFPINESFGRWERLKGKTDDIPVINAEVEEYCKQNGIAYMDMFSLLKCPENNSMRKEYCKDGLHLLPAGYDVWASVIQRYIDNLL